MINEKLIYYFANVIGCLKIAINLESLKDIRTKYEMVLDELLKWTKYYYENKKISFLLESVEFINLKGNFRMEFYFNLKNEVKCNKQNTT